MNAHHSAHGSFRAVFFAFLIILLATIFVTPGLSAGGNIETPTTAVVLMVDTTTDSNSSAYRACTPAPNDCSLRGAISVANANPQVDYTIVLSASTYTLSLAGIDDANATGDLDLISNSVVSVTGVLSSTTVIQAASTPGSGNDRVFHMLGNGHLLLSDLTVRNGDTDGYSSTDDRGGGVYLRMGSLTVSQTRFTGNTSRSGGAINGRSQSVDLQILDSRFDSNDAEFGGAVTTNSGNVRIGRSRFEANNAEFSGGALYLDADTQIYDSEFTDNQTLTNCNCVGGAIVVGKKTTTILNSSFDGNKSDTAGAIFVDVGPLFVYSSSFSANEALTGNGGAIQGEAFFIPASTIVVHNSTFTANKAKWRGGAIQGSAATVGGTEYYPTIIQVYHSTFDSNQTTSRDGGALQSFGWLDVDGSTFLNNNSGSDGGAIALSMTGFDALLTVRNSTFVANTALGKGGVIYGEDDGVITITHSTLSGNGASTGGGVAIYDQIDLHLSNTIIANSTQGSDCANNANIVTNIANLVEDGTCSPAVTGDPLLGPLQDNGGSTLTMALLPGSPAINQGDAAFCETFDQRSFFRLLPCDIGAFEVDVLSPFKLFLPIILHQ